MTNKGLNLKELRDEMHAALRRDSVDCNTTVSRWVNALDDIMQLPEYDPNQLHLFAPTPAARSTDPGTSHAAAQAVTKHPLSKMRRNILHLLAHVGPMCDPILRMEYLIEFGGDYAESTIRKRRNECVAMGWVHNNGGETIHHGGQQYTLWSITSSGLSALDKEE